MKRISFVLLIMFMASVMPVLAAFCHNCGKELPAVANFCPACGKASAGAFQTAQPAEPSQTAQPARVESKETTVPQSFYTPEPVPVTIEDSSIAAYNYINQMEALLTSSSYGVASRQTRELRSQNEHRMAKLESGYRYFSNYQRKLHDLHLKKQKAVEDYLEAWKGTEYGPDRARASAEKDRALFVLSAVNEMIDSLLTGGGTLTSIARVEEMETRLIKTSANYVITAPYLLVDNQRLNRGEPVWIIDVVVAEAKVLHMGKGRSSLPVCGWVSIYDLEKRTNWRSDPAFFFSPPSVQTTSTTVIYQPAPEPPVKVIIYGKKRYPYRHDRHDRRDRHDRDKRRDPRDDHRHRRYDYLVIKPRFW